MMPLPSSRAVPYGYERRDVAAEYAKLELRDGGAWLLAPAHAPAAPEVREALPVRPVSTLAKLAQALGAFFL